MIIDFECSGGYGGLRLSYRGDTNGLAPEKAKKLLDLIEASNLFDLSPKHISQKLKPIPDDFSCRLTISAAEKKKTLSFSELGAPENLRRLSVYLRKLAIQQKGK